MHINAHCLCLQCNRAAEDLCITASLQLTKTSGRILYIHNASELC